MNDDQADKILMDIAVNSWRFSCRAEHLRQKLSLQDQKRFDNQIRYFKKQIEDSLLEVGLKIVNLEGLEYENGMAVVALNKCDFEPDDSLIVEQMIEPVIMGSEGVVRSGTVTLRKV